MTFQEDRDQPVGDTGQTMTLAAFLADLLNTRECRSVLRDLALDTLAIWSENSYKKKTVAKALNRLIQKVLTIDDENRNVSEVFAEPGLVDGVLGQAPAVTRSVVDLSHALLASFERMPDHRKQVLFSALLSSLDGEKIGEMVTALARSLQSVHGDSPTFFADLLLPVLDGLLARTDLGEIKDTLSHFHEDGYALVHGALDLVFSYPTKLISLLSFIPGAANLVTYLLGDLLAHINTLPPDIFTDVLVTLFKKIDEKQIAHMINTASELIRQVHTGSALIGEAGTPQFSVDLMKKTRSLADELDPVRLLKARKALIEGRDVLSNTVIRAAFEKPELLKLHLHQLALTRNVSIRSLKHKIECIEDLPEEEAVDAIAVGLSSWNAYDLAEVVNAGCRMVNRIHDFKPEFLTSLVSEFIRSLDLFEVEDFLSWFSRDMGETVRPVVRTVAPHLVREVLTALSPEDDGNDEAIADARDLLRQFIMKGEERS